MSIEKCLSLYFPFKTKSMCTVQIAKRVILITALVFVAFESEFFFIIKKVSHNVCDYVRVSLSYPLIFNRIDSILYSFGPFTIKTLANCLIIYKFMSVMCKNQQSGTESTSQALSKFAGKETAMLVTISVIFIILTGPVSVIYFFEVEPHPLVRVVVRVMGDLNHAINGVLYCIARSRFRNELVKTLSCCKETRTHKDGSYTTDSSAVTNLSVTAFPE